MVVLPTDIPASNADVTIARTSSEGVHERATLDYESWRREPETSRVLVRCYDAQGASVTIFLSQSLVEEMVFGEISHVHTP